MVSVALSSLTMRLYYKITAALCNTETMFYRKYSQLPEVVQKKAKERLKQQSKTNRLRAQLYKQVNTVIR